MPDDSRTEDRPSLYKSEIFRDRPQPVASHNAITAEQGLEVFGGLAARRQRPARTYLEPAREIPVFGEADVLVVGGGPAATATATAAARRRARVTLVERSCRLVAHRAA